ncbi:cAMP-dependent protein kinase catalytic subunit PRKX [Lates japonicus]|uniref:cAMP-dependent protein kinase catalytic subunit PRKX n=1 Tax=Lates japonicus TaxID=270547 RepID=A0AAD3NNI7_LATJO|nr:cAMP-dependent protein kinase catalytic subunit PRKX [Lates japonicus]
MAEPMETGELERVDGQRVLVLQIWIHISPLAVAEDPQEGLDTSPLVIAEEPRPSCGCGSKTQPKAFQTYPPFFDDNPFGIYQKILAGKLEFPRHLDFYVKDLKKFLVIDQARRLGNMKNGADDVKKHRWFKTIDWEAVPLRKLKVRAVLM